jgi:phosphatidylglycerol:prolipoprotein diacylglycerol transferase
MRPVLFHIGDVAIPSFWAMAFLGFVVAFLVTRSEVVRRGYDVALAYDLLLWSYVGGWVGARVFLIPTGWQYLRDDPFAFLFSSSGWVWYGGVVGGAAAIILWWWKSGRQPALSVLADIAAPALAVGLAIGRVGCQLSGDGDYGVATDLPWAMSYPNGVVPTTERVHPTPIYEMLGCLAIFAYLWRRRGRPLPPGDQFGRYLVLSGALRFPIELVRRNPAWLLGLTTAQWFSIGAVAVGLAVVRWGARRRSKGPEEELDLSRAQ